MATINPYLNFNGNTEEAFNFYKSVFGGEFLSVHRFGDMPEEEKKRIPEADRSKIMHISLPIGNENFLMGTDTLGSIGQKLTSGNNFYISVQATSEEEADEIFNKLSDSGNVELPIQKVSWGDYFGMFADKFGIQWMINYSYPTQG